MARRFQLAFLASPPGGRDHRRRQRHHIQALRAAANRKLPVAFFVCNNGGYRIIKQRLKAFHGDDRFIGMDFQDLDIDVAGLARSFDVQAQRVEDAADFDAASKKALAGTESVLLDVIVDGTV
jgi:benzoylformate decarboxylase